MFFFDSGWMDETREGPDENEPGELGQYKTYFLSAQAAFAKSITDYLKVGATAKYIREDIEYSTAQTIAFDIGVNYDLGFLGFVLGASLNNIGPGTIKHGQHYLEKQ